MKYKTKTNIIMASVVVIIIVFFAGLELGRSRSSINTTDDQGGQQTQRGTSRGTNGRGFGAGERGGGTFGQIVAVDDKSITVQQRDGSSKIVFIAGSTSVTKSAPGSVKDLQVGQQITVTGTINSDGSE
ncbi:MAG: hypothetical protein HY225_02870, partial [Candidatus Vogelbacteria bacterium]|nr:hypothetical protein [Candidatus Vogelbacteria bacterium]